MISIEPAKATDLELLSQHDMHISKPQLAQKISRKEVYLIRKDSIFAGWLRYGLFWDNTPFLNILYLLEPCRGQGLGRQTMLYWERQMRSQGYTLLMTSTLSNEQAQHFYRRLGYRDAGGLLLGGEPLEIIFTKSL